MEEQQAQKIFQKETNSYKVYLKLPSDKVTEHQFTFGQDQISIQSQQTTIFLPFRDIIGIKIQNVTDLLYKITVTSFPIRKKFFRKQGRCLQFTQFWIQIETKEEVQDLELQLIKKITNRQIQSPKDLKLLAYYNPAAGSNSKQHLNRVQNFLQHTNFQLQVVQTQGRNFLIQHIQQIQLSQYQAVLIISGDGLMHEFVNSKGCGNVPVSHVPAGSGNAFAKTQTTTAGEQCSSQVAAFLAVKGRVKAFNIFKIQLQKIPEPIYSFLSVEWAFLADIDINSQFLRFCGGLRFEVYSVWRCIAMRRYPGKIYFSFEDKQLPPIQQPIQDPTFQLVQTDYLCALFTTIPYISDKYQFSPLLKIEDKAVDMQLVTAEHGRWNLIKYLLNSESGAHFDREKGDLKQGAGLSWGKIKCYRIEPLGQGQLKGLFGIDGQHYQAQRLQASLSDRQLLSFV